MKFVRKSLSFLLVFLVLFGGFTFLQFGFVPTVKADSGTFQISISSNDGEINGVSTSYATAHDVASAFDPDAMFFGQYYAAPNYAVFRNDLKFDTSSIPAGSTISAADLDLYGITIDDSDTDFTINIQKWTGDTPINTADYNQFDGINYDNGLFSTSSWVVDGWNNITLSTFSVITTGGNTLICLRSSRDISSTVPTGYEIVYINDYGQDPSKAAVLRVTYTSIAPEYDYVDSQSNVDGVSDVGTHSSFAAQQATDWTNDTLTEANTNTTVSNNAENFVDANTSDQDGHTGHGTSSNFTAQQDANVLYNDTLTEAQTTGNVTSNVFTDGFEDGTFGKWDGNGATTWGDGATFMATNSSPGSPWVTHSGTYMVDADANDDGNLTSDSIITGSMQAIGISFWYMNDDGDGDDFSFQVYDGSTWDRITWLGDSGTTNEDVWLFYSWVTTDTSQYMYSTFHFGFTAAFAANEGGFIDDVVVNATTKNNYELDYEFSWTTASFSEANEYLCIRTNSYTGTAENLGVDVWDGSWKSVSNALTASSWNNISISSNLTGTTIYFRFIGKTESSDTAQNTWSIECNLIHVWSVGVNYELDLEEQFTSANFSRTNVELCIRMASQNNSEVLSLDYWNTSSSAWIVAIATLTMNQWNNVSVKAYTSNASVTFTVKLVDNTKSGDIIRDAWNKDACLLHTWDAVGNQAPTNDACDSTAAFDVDIDGWVNMTVSDPDLVADLYEAKINVSTYDAKFFVLNWTQSTNAFAEVADANAICALSGTSTRVNVDADTDRICFLFQVNVAVEKGYCSVNATTTDDGALTDTDTCANEFSIAAYSSLTFCAGNSTHTFSGDQGENNVLIDQGVLYFNATTNFTFDIQAKSNDTVLHSVTLGYTINVGNVTVNSTTASQNGVTLTTDYQDLTDLISHAMGQEVQLGIKVWLNIPPNQPATDDYVYELYLQTTQS